jgi:hypothetical protein
MLVSFVEKSCLFDDSDLAWNAIGDRDLEYGFYQRGLMQLLFTDGR